jgi:hypothetical protein
MITPLIAALAAIAVPFMLLSGYIGYRRIDGATKPAAFWPMWFYFFRAWSLTLATVELYRLLLLLSFLFPSVAVLPSSCMASR